MAIRDDIVDLLRAERTAMRAVEIAERLNVNYRTISKDLTRLCRAERAERVGRGLYRYRVPGNIPFSRNPNLSIPDVELFEFFEGSVLLQFATFRAKNVRLDDFQPGEYEIQYCLVNGGLPKLEFVKAIVSRNGTVSIYFSKDTDPMGLADASVVFASIINWFSIKFCPDQLNKLKLESFDLGSRHAGNYSGPYREITILKQKIDKCLKGLKAAIYQKTFDDGESNIWTELRYRAWNLTAEDAVLLLSRTDAYLNIGNYVRNLEKKVNGIIRRLIRFVSNSEATIENIENGIREVNNIAVEAADYARSNHDSLHNIQTSVDEISGEVGAISEQINTVTPGIGLTAQGMAENLQISKQGVETLNNIQTNFGQFSESIADIENISETISTGVGAVIQWIIQTPQQQRSKSIQISIIQELRISPGASISELSNITGIDRKRLGKHLRYLENQGKIRKIKRKQKSRIGRKSYQYYIA